MRFKKKKREVLLINRGQNNSINRDQEHHLDQFFNASPVAMRIVDINYNVIKQNYQMSKITGVDYKTAKDMKCYDQYFGEACNTDTCTLKRILNGEVYVQIETEKYNKFGDSLPVMLTAIPYYDEDGNIIGIFESFQDISILKKKEKKLNSLMEKLSKNMESTIFTLAAVVEKRDPYIAGHQKRVGVLASAIGEEMGLSPNMVKGLKVIGSLHDIGKIQTPFDLLNKPGKISENEFELIKEHSTNGYELLKEIEFEEWPVAETVLQHHETLDGKGYPQGLKGEDILLEAKIITVADVVEAMASHRPYRPALGIDAALEEIKRKRGEKFEPEIVDTCTKLFENKGFKFDTGW